MDYTEKYYLMCEKAKKYLFNISDDAWVGREIGIRGRIGIILKCDYSVGFNGKISTKGKIKIYYRNTDYKKNEKNLEEKIVLVKDIVPIFKQDRLQNEISDKGYFRFSLIELFYHFANSVIVNNKQQINSENFITMEQLWLMFVMDKKFKKKWNGRNWIKE